MDSGSKCNLLTPMPISIVIPTLNEEKTIPEVIQAIWKHAEKPQEIEVLVVDSGSDDHTLETAAATNARVFSEPSFKYKKYLSLNFGLKAAQSEVVLFLDADTLLPHHFDRLIYAALRAPEVAGGAFEFSLDQPGLLYLLITWTNRIRYRLSPIYHGDQAIFCRKPLAVDIDGFPPEPLMEAAFFTKKLRKKGQLVLIKTPIITSSRRFRDNGPWRVIWFDVYMWIRFVLGLPVAAFAKKYWKQV